jgi:hypothetical protein
MKISLFVLLVLTLLVGYPCHSQEIALMDANILTIQKQTLMPFFEALKNGDVLGIKKHISGNLYAKSRALLDENQNYPAFLKNYYRDVIFTVIKAEKEIAGEGIVFFVSLQFPSGSVSINELKLSKKDPAGLQSDAWVIEKF